MEVSNLGDTSVNTVSSTCMLGQGANHHDPEHRIADSDPAITSTVSLSYSSDCENSNDGMAFFAAEIQEEDVESNLMQESENGIFQEVLDQENISGLDNFQFSTFHACVQNEASSETELTKSNKDSDVSQVDANISESSRHQVDTDRHDSGVTKENEAKNAQLTSKRSRTRSSCDRKIENGTLVDSQDPSPSASGRVSSEKNQHDERRRSSKRTRKRNFPSESSHVTCPSCNMSLKTEDLANHVETEILKLEKQYLHRKKHSNFKKPSVSTCPTRSTNPDDPEAEVMDSQSRYKSYLKIRTRRERRNCAKKRKAGPGEEQTKCPVCDDVITGTADELAEHVDQCLIQQEEYGEELDVEGEDSNGFEEYTWAGQTRIRATTMLEGGLAASGFQVTSVSNPDDDDVDLDIDGDDSNVYGNAQYTEADLLPCNSEEPEEEKERKALRNAVLRGEGGRVSRSVPCDRQRWKSSKSEDKRIRKSSEEDGLDNSNTEVIESLKARLRDQEVQLDNQDRPKCLICMEFYTKPLTSVQCWHVHCEECWLRTLGTKKLCPQCNTITSPADLRRIYL